MAGEYTTSVAMLRPVLHSQTDASFAFSLDQTKVSDILHVVAHVVAHVAQLCSHGTHILPWSLPAHLHKAATVYE